MKKLIWSLQILVSLVIGGFGLQKVVMEIPDLIGFGMLWIEDFPAWQVRAIGALEVLGAIGLNAPYIVKALPKQLVPLAAGGLAITMVGAVVTHVTRGDVATSIVITSVLSAMCSLIAVKRFGELKEGAGVAAPADAVEA